MEQLTSPVKWSENTESSHSRKIRTFHAPFRSKLYSQKTAQFNSFFRVLHSGFFFTVFGILLWSFMYILYIKNIYHLESGLSKNFIFHIQETFRGKFYTSHAWIRLFQANNDTKWQFLCVYDWMKFSLAFLFFSFTFLAFVQYIHHCSLSRKIEPF